MDTILNFADVIVLLLLVIQVPLTVWKAQGEGPVFLILSICVALFTIIFGVVSFAASVGFFSDIPMKVVWFAILLVMANLVRLTRAQLVG